MKMMAKRCLAGIAWAVAAVAMLGCGTLPVPDGPKATGPVAPAATTSTSSAAPPSQTPNTQHAGASPTSAQPMAVTPAPSQALAETAGPTPPVARVREAPAVSLRSLTQGTPDDEDERSDLWERLRRGFAMPNLEPDLVRRWEQWYAARPDYVQRMTERGSRYLFHVVEEVQRRGLPTELALLPFIESAFNPQALSVASASGIWQFMPATGRQFELKQNLFRDDRRDILASTRAALDYLQMLHQMFGDWHLALAAYNWGQGNVQRALDRNRRAREEAAYTHLRMPDETRNYVPKLQAMKNIVGSPATFGLSLPPLENHPFFLTVTIERDIDAEVVARLAGLSMESFLALNPQLNKPVLLAAGTPQVLLPYDNANRFLRELPLQTGPLASLTAWVAPRTLRLSEASRLTGVPEARLRELNRIPDRMLIAAGSALIIPRRPDHLHDVTENLADQASMQLKPDGPRLVRKSVKASAKGESLLAFARRQGVDPADIARWNKLPLQAMLRGGQSVTLMVPAPSMSATAPPPARSAKAAPRTSSGKARTGPRKSATPSGPGSGSTIRR